MSSYTTELRTFFDQYSHYTGNPPLFPSETEKIEMGRDKLFDFNYPLFDPEYKKVFETNFIRNFYMREIGSETFGLFKFRLETWLNINMPYWNKMFESELLQYDPLTNASMDVTHNKTTDKTQNDTRNITGSNSTTGTSEADSNSTNTQTLNTNVSKTENGTLIDDNFDRQIESDNPDNRLFLTTNDGEGVIEYAKAIKENNENNKQTKTGTATNATTGTVKDDADSSQKTSVDYSGEETKQDTLNSSINDVEDFVQHRVGKIGVQSYAKLITEYRQSLLRIEKQIFNEMNELFMLVY